MDEQTILSNQKRFKKTPYRYHSRTIYQEKITCRYWYVDNLHEGKRAHLEVFDKTGQHIGEADLEGHIDETKQDPTKNINLK